MNKRKEKKVENREKMEKRVGEKERQKRGLERGRNFQNETGKGSGRMECLNL